MARTCTICTHPERAAIDKALVNGVPLRGIAGQYGLTDSSLARHKAEHLPATLVRAQRGREQTHALGVMEELERCVRRINLLLEACDRWLRDPDDPSRYSLDPRAEEVQVIYTTRTAQGPVRRRVPLSHLLEAVTHQSPGLVVEHVENKSADPRELLLKSTSQLKGQIELLAKLLGQLDERPAVNVLVAPEWLTIRAGLLAALGPYPEARAAVAAQLLALETSNGRH
jgi:hypothetical protein